MAIIKSYEKKDGSAAYQFSVYLGVDEETGKKKRTTRRGFKTKKEAKRALARLEAGVDVPQNKTKKQPKYTTFCDVYAIWWETYIQKGLKLSTVARTENYFKCHILPILGDKVITALTPLDCQKAVNGWSKELIDFAPYKAYASQVLRFAKDTLQLIDSNPMDVVEMPRKRKSKKADSDKYYTEAELTAFLTWLKTNRPEKEFVLFRLLAFTGLRKAELCALTWDDIDFVQSTLRVNKALMRVEKVTYVADPKTEKSKRTIAMDAKTLRILKKWKWTQKKDFLREGIIVKSDSDQYLFTNQTNGLLYDSYLRDVIERYPGKQLTPHGFRHTHATLLLNNGVSANDVANRLGHATVKMTLDVYGHASKDDQFIADRFVKVVEGYSKG